MKRVMDTRERSVRWQSFRFDLQTRVCDHVAILAPRLILDEAEGVCLPPTAACTERRRNCRILVPRRSLVIGGSGTIRKKAGSVRSDGQSPSRLSQTDPSMMQLFPTRTGSESTVDGPGRRHINRLVNELACVGSVSDHGYDLGAFLKAFIDAQWLRELVERLSVYRGATNWQRRRCHRRQMDELDPVRLKARPSPPPSVRCTSTAAIFASARSMS